MASDMETVIRVVLVLRQSMARTCKKTREGQGLTTSFRGSLGYTSHCFLVASLLKPSLYHGYHRSLEGSLGLQPAAVWILAG